MKLEWVIPDYEQAFGTSSLRHDLCKGTFIQTKWEKNTYLQSAVMWRGWGAFMNSFSVFILSLWSLCSLGITFTGYLEDGSLSEEKLHLVTSGWFEVLTLQMGSGKDEMRADGSGFGMRSQTKIWKLLSLFQAKPPGGGIKCVYLSLQVCVSLAVCLGNRNHFSEVDWKSVLCIFLCCETCKLCSD